MFNCPSFFPPALASTSVPRGPESQPTPDDKAARWAPARCTTWHTASTNSATNSRSGPPPSTRSAHRDTGGGVDLFQSAESHWEWSRAGWGPCGASLTLKYTSSRLSSDGHERDFAGGEWKQKRGSRTESGSSLLCSKILQMPQTPAKKFSSTFLFRHEDWVRAALRSYKDWSSQLSSVDIAAGLHSLGAALCLAEGKEER